MILYDSLQHPSSGSPCSLTDMKVKPSTGEKVSIQTSPLLWQSDGPIKNEKQLQCSQCWPNDCSHHWRQTCLMMYIHLIHNWALDCSWGGILISPCVLWDLTQPLALTSQNKCVDSWKVAFIFFHGEMSFQCAVLELCDLEKMGVLCF